MNIKTFQITLRKRDENDSICFFSKPHIIRGINLYEAIKNCEKTREQIAHNYTLCSAHEVFPKVALNNIEKLICKEWFDEGK